MAKIRESEAKQVQIQASIERERMKESELIHKISKEDEIIQHNKNLEIETRNRHIGLHRKERKSGKTH